MLTGVHVDVQQAGPRPSQEKLEEAVHIKHLLGQNTQELSSILNALEGRYVTAAPGGDLLRDGAGVLPTGAWNFEMKFMKFIMNVNE